MLTMASTTAISTDLLMPSQAITSNTTNRRNRSRNRRKNRDSTTASSHQSSPSQRNSEVNTNETTTPPAAAGRRRRPRKKKNETTDASKEGLKTEETGELDSSPQNRTNRQKNKKKQPRRKNNKKHAWWRKQVPPEAVDPITLDALISLDYAPFALVATEPYVPIDWPFVQTALEVEEEVKKVEETDEERERRILQEQWGKHVQERKETSEEAKASPPPPPPPPSQRPVNLFDGRALAYYMVSQLQFIDPLNRRDLTRDELVHLDRYLRKNGFPAAVTEAYDAKGVTISTAGAASHTAAGRATLLQQEARVLLNALFGNLPSASAASPTPNALMRQYEEHEASRQQQQRNVQSDNRSRAAASQRRIEEEQEEDIGIYGDDAGLVVIDDDINPGLRGSAPAFVPSTVGTLYSASHIARQYQGHAARAQEHEFPSLSALTVATQEPPPQSEPPKKVLPKAKTLSKIGSMVKKTNPEEQQRQWEAREEARRKAMLSHLTFGSNQVAWGGPSDKPNGFPTQITTKTITVPTEAQLERNRAFAAALGVQPATTRTMSAGWTRPSERKIEFDEFGNELNATLYPEPLILRAREMRLDFLLKLERKWKNFLADDNAASLPLSKMDRDTRTFVHEYSDYWKLHTESFDPEPRRYIHCVKLRDTSAPYPLLSDVVRTWRPGMTRPASDHPSQQTAGQSTRSAREIPPPPDRMPLSLKPRSTDISNVVVELPSSAPSSGGVSIGGAPSRTMVAPEADKHHADSRFSSLADGRERPKLELKKRTAPLELPPFKPPTKGFDISEDLERQKERAAAKARKEKEDEERKQRALQAAFASDDEGNNNSSSDSEWEEQVAAYSGSDEEEE